MSGHPADPASLDPLKRYRFRDRVKFTMKRQILRTKMNEIRHSIDGLTTFIERADRLHNGQSLECSEKVQFLVPLDSIRANACDVHEILLSRWCDAHAPHRAAILLEDRLYRRRRGSQPSRSPRQEEVNKAKCFALCLNDHVPHRWQSTAVRPVEISSR